MQASDRTAATGLRARLHAISERDLDDRTLTPSEADVLLAALATLAGLVWVANRNHLASDPYVIQAQAVLDEAGWNTPVGRGTT